MKRLLNLLLILISLNLYGQEDAKQRNFGIQAGVNAAILDNAFGPSVSVHYTFRPQKVLSLESMLFFDAHSGEAFISANPKKASAFGFASGLRINIFPQKNWNPSFLLMPGIAYSSAKYANNPREAQVSAAFCAAFSNTFQQKHSISLGANASDYVFALFLKYGFWL